MQNLFKIICWAALMLGVAMMGAEGAISRDMEQTMIVLIPVFAIMSLTGRMGCNFAGGHRP